MHGYPELPPNMGLDPYSGAEDTFFNQGQPLPSPTAQGFGEFGDPLMPPAPNDQHSYTGQMSHMSDITSDPGY